MVSTTNVMRYGLSTSKSLLRVAVAAVVAIGFSGLTPVVAHADGGVGTIVQQSTATLPSDLASIATGKRIVYVTSDVNGTSVNSSGLVITPNVRPAHPKIVAWAHALTGLADKCAPSVDPTNY